MQHEAYYHDKIFQLLYTVTMYYKLVPRAQQVKIIQTFVSFYILKIFPHLKNYLLEVSVKTLISSFNLNKIYVDSYVTLLRIKIFKKKIVIIFETDYISFIIIQSISIAVLNNLVKSINNNKSMHLLYIWICYHFSILCCSSKYIAFRFFHHKLCCLLLQVIFIPWQISLLWFLIVIIFI